MSAAGRIMQLARLAQQVAALIDTGDHDTITPQEVRAPAFVDELFRLIHASGGRAVDRSAHLGYVRGPSEDFRAWFCGEIATVAAETVGEDWRLWQVEKRGLCLMLIWIADLVGAEAETLRED